MLITLAPDALAKLDAVKSAASDPSRSATVARLASEAYDALPRAKRRT